MPKYHSVFCAYILSLLCLLNISCNAGSADFKTQPPPIPTLILLKDMVQVQKVTSTLKLDSFYKKYLSADGLLIVSSSQVPDEALL